MVHSAKKKIRKHRGVDESPLNNEVLNTILLVSCLCMLSAYKTCISCFHWCIGFIVYGRIINKGLWCQFFYLSCIYQLFETAQVVTSLYWKWTLNSANSFNSGVCWYVTSSSFREKLGRAGKTILMQVWIIIFLPFLEVLISWCCWQTCRWIWKQNEHFSRKQSSSREWRLCKFYWLTRMRDRESNFECVFI